MGVILRAHSVRGETHIQCNASGVVATNAINEIINLWELNTGKKITLIAY